MPATYPRTKNDMFDPRMVDSIWETERRLGAIRKSLRNYGISPEEASEITRKINRDLGPDNSYMFVESEGKILCIENYRSGALIHEVGGKVIEELNYTSRGWETESKSIREISEKIEEAKNFITPYIDSESPQERRIMRGLTVEVALSLHEDWKPEVSAPGFTFHSERYGEVDVDNIDRVSLMGEINLDDQENRQKMYDAFATMHVANRENGLPDHRLFSERPEQAGRATEEIAEDYLEFRGNVGRKIRIEHETNIPVDVKTFSSDPVKAMELFSDPEVCDEIVDALKEVGVSPEYLKGIAVVDTERHKGDSVAMRELKKEIKGGMAYDLESRHIFMSQEIDKDYIVNGGFQHEVLHGGLRQDYGDFEKIFNGENKESIKAVIINHEEVADNLKIAGMMKEGGKSEGYKSIIIRKYELYDDTKIDRFVWRNIDATRNPDGYKEIAPEARGIGYLAEAAATFMHLDRGIYDKIIESFERHCRTLTEEGEHMLREEEVSAFHYFIDIFSGLNDLEVTDYSESCRKAVRTQRWLEDYTLSVDNPHPPWGEHADIITDIEETPLGDGFPFPNGKQKHGKQKIRIDSEGDIKTEEIRIGEKILEIKYDDDEP